MSLLFAIDDSGRRALRAAVLASAPDLRLRERILRRYRRKRALERLARGAAVAALLALGLALGVREDDSRHAWQSRSMALEAAWRDHADPAWLLEDARAQRLVQRLRRIDSALERHLADADDEAATVLWRERSETLSALIANRRQGGVATRI